MKPAHWSLRQLLRMSAGLFLWGSAFIVLYAGLSLGCQNLDIPDENGLFNGLSAALVMAVMLHAAALVVLLILQHRRPVKAGPDEDERSRMLRQRVEGLVLWVSLAALFFLGFPLLMVPPCAG